MFLFQNTCSAWTEGNKNNYIKPSYLDQYHQSTGDNNSYKYKNEKDMLPYFPCDDSSR